jgi:hypothetical protein
MQEEICMDGRNPLHLVLAGLSVVITLQIGGFALLWSKDIPLLEYGYLPVTANKTAADSSVNTPVVVVSPPDEKALREIIQTVLKQELAPYAHQLAATPVATQKIPPAIPAGVKENSPENLQAFENIKNIVDMAIAKGKWTMDDTIAASAHSKNITENQRIELINKIGNAINNQTMGLNPESPPTF